MKDFGAKHKLRAIASRLRASLLCYLRDANNNEVVFTKEFKLFSFIAAI